MSISDEIYSLCKLYYGPRDGFPGIFYIRENSPLFPDTFPPMQGRKLGKGSYYKTQKVVQNEDSIVVEITVHIKPQSNNDGTIELPSEEFIIYQKDVFTWDDQGTVFVLVDYLDSEDGHSVARTTGTLIKYSADQWIFDFEVTQLPACPPLTTQPWKEEVSSCFLKVLHTDTLINDDVSTRNTVYSYDLMYIAFVNDKQEIVGTLKIDPSQLFVPDNPFLNATSNPVVWEKGL